MQLNKELFEQIKQTKSPEELLTLAKNNGYQMTEEEANKYFNQLNSSGELADDELANVAGGGCSHTKTNYSICENYQKEDSRYYGEPYCENCMYLGRDLGGTYGICLNKGKKFTFRDKI